MIVTTTAVISSAISAATATAIPWAGSAATHGNTASAAKPWAGSRAHRWRAAAHMNTTASAHAHAQRTAAATAHMRGTAATHYSRRVAAGRVLGEACGRHSHRQNQGYCSDGTQNFRTDHGRLHQGGYSPTVWTGRRSRARPDCARHGTETVQSELYAK